MNVGVIGLGRMGNAVAFRALKGGHTVVGFDLDVVSCKAAAAYGAHIVGSIAELVQLVEVVWMMVPAGAIVDTVLQEIILHSTNATIVVDGGNSHFVDSIRRARMLAEKKISFLDCGTSGGIAGKEHGFSLMVGGNAQDYARIEPLLKALAAPGGVGHVGPAGAGHYVKMVHNGIEYGLMQAYAEGFHAIKEGTFKEHTLDLEKITRIWMNGAVIRSWLLELSHDVFVHDQDLKNISGVVAESGMGKWTVQEAQQHAVPVSVIKESLDVRAHSRETGGNYATKVVSLLRNAFGGHSVGQINQEEK